MYTIIAGTNRMGSATLNVAKEYQRFLKDKGLTASVLSLEGINLMYRDAALEKIENDILIPTTKFIFLLPEYNGSFPGALKMLIDISKSNTIWWHKKALLTGLSTGRAGNLRGMEHFMGVLNYLKITVYPNLLPISVVDALMDDAGKFTDVNTIKIINNQLDGFLKWSK